MSWPPVQFPWETPPQTYGPYQKRTSVGRKAGAPYQNVKSNPLYYKRGFTTSRMSSSTTSAAMRYKQGLSDATRSGTNWFRKVPPGKVTNIKNTKPLWQQGRVINRSTSTSLATRGAVGLGVIKQGGGGMGQFSK